jgi:hypothetical protein
MTIQRFNWDSWDVVVPEVSGGQAGDVNRTDYLYPCASEIPGTSAASPSASPIVPGLSGCQLYMPPRISDINIVPSALLEFYIYGSGIN